MTLFGSAKLSEIPFFLPTAMFRSTHLCKHDFNLVVDSFLAMTFIKKFQARKNYHGN